ncbi:fungal-specific transcription factor domain-containing protein [Amylocarpus encephaloides]|uniref:Fungal-specific transcription factor domain-containing protein n=1 Tax=Amylocarpus encephaloides TaxID=45428 RepID=A0A9P7YID4_9HELO|nr:fungal-specific transcription factor domain-containing protein [Amylocarpus encephaloides]
MTEGEDAPGLPPPSGDATSIRRKHPCVLCQSRKVKCDRNNPCANCTKARVECVSTSILPPKRRKKRFPEAELLARLRRYEAHLRNYGADIDAINQEEMPPPLIKSVAPSEEDFSQITAGCRSLSVRKAMGNTERYADRYGMPPFQEFHHNINSNFWSGVNDAFQDVEEILRGSSEDEDYENPIKETYDNIYTDSSDLLFGPKKDLDITLLHPSPVHIFQLWQAFLDNVNPLLKMIHTPTVQQQLLDATSELSNVSKSMHVLMFGIYCMAATSMSEEEIRTIFGQEKEDLLKQCQGGAQQALLQAGFLRTSDLMVLQGYVLYLLSNFNQTVDPRVLFCWSGIAVRIAQTMGLNFDGTHYSLSPFETEMRRRVWWQIIFMDARVGELAGNHPNVAQHLKNYHLPLNVNDSDLYPGMKDFPTEHAGGTEMIFVRPRCEITKFSLGISPDGMSLGGPARVDDSTLDAFSAHILEKYIKYCDTHIPIHVLARLNTVSNLSKLRFKKAMHPHKSISHLEAASRPDQEALFLHALQMVESYYQMTSTKSLERYLWHVYKHAPFPAHIYVLGALRNRKHDDTSERAWKALEGHFEGKFGVSHFQWKTKANIWKSPLHRAVSNLTIKAWEAREAALEPYGQPLETPRFIAQMRADLAAVRKSTPTSSSATQSEPSPPSQMCDIDMGIGGFGGSGQPNDPFAWINQPSDGMMDQALVFEQTTMGTATNDSNWMWNDWSQITPGTGTGPLEGMGMMGMSIGDPDPLGIERKYNS